MIPIVSSLYAQPGVLVGLGVGICIGMIVSNHLNDKRDTDELEDEEEYLLDEDSPEENLKFIIVVRTDLKMGKGKVAAQVVVKAESAEEILEIGSIAESVDLCTSLIQDAGRTQVAPGSLTVLGIGPGPIDLIDRITGHLKLY
ncbi:Peptidyl-tRNA hydrolase 2, mitochondrial [Armadillidium vulgare]|nr:Peptidyl-tRNA hydrolase 2, mitochondrial [Armadillidium vulgare]